MNTTSKLSLVLLSAGALFLGAAPGFAAECGEQDFECQIRKLKAQLEEQTKPLRKQIADLQDRQYHVFFVKARREYIEKNYLARFEAGGRLTLGDPKMPGQDPERFGLYLDARWIGDFSVRLKSRYDPYSLDRDLFRKSVSDTLTAGKIPFKLNP